MCGWHCPNSNADYFRVQALTVQAMDMGQGVPPAVAVPAEEAVSVWMTPLTEAETPVLNHSPMSKLQLQHVCGDGSLPCRTKKGWQSPEQQDLYTKVTMVLKHNHNRFPWNTWTDLYKGAFNLLDDVDKSGSVDDMTEKFQYVVDRLRTGSKKWILLRTNEEIDWMHDDHYQFQILGDVPEVPVDKTDRTVLENAWSVRSLCNYISKSKHPKPGYNAPISLLRAIHFFPNRKMVPQNVGNVAIELSQWPELFQLDPPGPYVFNSDDDVIVRIKETETIKKYLADCQLSISNVPARSWRTEEVAQPHVGADAAMPQAASVDDAQRGRVAAGPQTEHWGTPYAASSATITMSGGDPCHETSGTSRVNKDGTPYDPANWVEHSNARGSGWQAGTGPVQASGSGSGGWQSWGQSQQQDEQQKWGKKHDDHQTKSWRNAQYEKKK
jgi:hypothetical protein